MTAPLTHSTDLTALTTGYTVHHPTPDDIPAILELLYAFDLAETGEADAYDTQDILNDWADLDPVRDAWVVFAPDGLLCGYGTVTIHEYGRIFEDGYVHPLHRERGIGATLLALMERRGGAIGAELAGTLPPDVRIALINNIIADSDPARALLEERGYELTRVYFRMSISLDAPPAPPQWPAGIAVRACDGSEEDIRRAYEVIEEGFQDHFAHGPRTVEEWRRHMVRDGLDYGLWLFAVEGDQIAGAALGREREPGKGWIDQVAVLRPWRKRGVGMALLRQAFGAFYQRGIARVGLGVDGQSLTGAQRLYERAGMTQTMRIGCYERELRPGTNTTPGV
ncbi:MAG TPA: GNAT family N-acetyltransferase [Ktedonobacterales bacterium]|jgi:GNAT superfamily N-acetyltransferase